MSYKLSTESGFSLLEILVAFSIMGLALGIMLKIFSSGVLTASLSEEYIVATQIAESLMAAAGVEKPLLTGEEQGLENDKYHWRVSVEMLPDVSEELAQVELLTVQVYVSWGESEQAERAIELNTVKTGQIRK